MSQTEHFVVNSERVVHETIDGETIIIQLETGTYYSLAGSGADIWAMLAEGRSSDEIVSELERRYDESAEELDQATAELVSELRREELLEDLPASALPARSQNGTESNASNTARMSFERP